MAKLTRTVWKAGDKVELTSEREGHYLPVGLKAGDQVTIIGFRPGTYSVRCALGREYFISMNLVPEPRSGP